MSRIIISKMACRANGSLKKNELGEFTATVFKNAKNYLKTRKRKKLRQ